VPDAAGAEADAEPAAAGVVEACAAGDVEAGADDVELELHPAISAAAAAIATAPVAMRARLSQIMVLTAPSTERPLARHYIGLFLCERYGNITISPARRPCTSLGRQLCLVGKILLSTSQRLQNFFETRLLNCLTTYFQSRRYQE
jgi:hypothetical protein